MKEDTEINMPVCPYCGCELVMLRLAIFVEMDRHHKDQPIWICECEKRPIAQERVRIKSNFDFVYDY